MLNELICRYPELTICREDIILAREAIIQCYKDGGKLLLCGNGGSSADCDHIVGELMKSFREKRRVTDERLPSHLREKLQASLPAISLSSQSAALTAFINDEDPSMVYAQLLYGYVKPEDLFVAISTSGNSDNVVNAATVAKALGIRTVALTGESRSLLSDLCDITVRVPESETYKVQELHLPIYHYLCASVEKYFFGN
ncbi:MAG: SIS domain-containing protein [Ruminococcaceae bacterium]|nr:SIS domain-containing protein [Oscillospiraceae bacterium]